MTKLNIEAEPGHSPKKEFLKELNIAFAKGDAAFIVNNVNDSIVWNIVGDKKIEGKDNFIKEMEIMKDYVADELTIHNIITHGAEGAVNGEMKMNGKKYAFCDIYQFTSAGKSIIKSMTSYVIET